MATFAIKWSNVLSNGQPETGTQMISSKTKDEAENIFKKSFKGSKVKIEGIDVKQK